MKKNKLVLPLLTMAAPALLPLVSCGSDNNTDPDTPTGKLEWKLGDGPYESKIEPDKEETLNDAKANALYFYKIDKNIDILADDFMSSEYCATTIKSNVIYCSFEGHVANVEKQLLNVTMLVKTQEEGKNEPSEFSLDFKNFKFLLTIVNNEPIVTPDWKYVDEDADWSCTGLIGDKTYTIDKTASEEDKNLLRRQIFHWCRFKSHYFMNKIYDPVQNPTEFNIEYSRTPFANVTASLKDLDDSKYCIHTAYEGSMTITAATLEEAKRYKIELWVDDIRIEPSWDTWKEVNDPVEEGNHVSIDITIIDQTFLQDAQEIEINFVQKG